MSSFTKLLSHWAVWVIEPDQEKAYFLTKKIETSDQVNYFILIFLSSPFNFTFLFIFLHFIAKSYFKQKN